MRDARVEDGAIEAVDPAEQGLGAIRIRALSRRTVELFDGALEHVEPSHRLTLADELLRRRAASSPHTAGLSRGAAARGRRPSTCRARTLAGAISCVCRGQR